MTIISIIAMFIGGFNWLSSGLLQYDFIAGFFGTQASIFSRLIYIAIGVCTSWLFIDLIKNKGKIIMFNRKKKKTEQEIQPVHVVNSPNQTNNHIQNNNDDIDLLS